ncbi:MAG TPA: glycerophosphodiester phosphodiesterase [Micromonosporaceae bacterium]|jgi:glycerophosphoryl diester phosphodiesterase
MLSAHRGGPEGLFEPNSLEAMKASLDVGVDLIEFDVRTTSDGGFVTFHDADVDIDGAPRPIAELTEDEVIAREPAAARVTDILHLIKGRALGHVDLKDTRLELEIADLCESVLGPTGFVLTTMEDESVARIRAGRPHLVVGLSLGRDSTGLNKLQEFQLRMSEIFPGRRVRKCRANMLALNYKIARLGALRWARRHHIDVLVWTINEPDLIRSIANDERYWAFTTDYPRLARQLRGAS